MSISFITFANTRTQQVLAYIANLIKIEEVKVVEKSPSQHGKVKDTISRAEVIGARDNKRRTNSNKRLQCYLNTIPESLIGELL